jgi:uncharacterized DUF497 family protein
MLDVQIIDGFDRDEGNIDKNWIKHQVTNSECEELFFNLPLLLADDKRHSREELRYYALGQTNFNRWLFIAFTIRDNKIRVISARDMNLWKEISMLKKIPKFQNEDEEREFWAQQDSTKYLNWGEAERVVFPKLKPATKTISLRISESMLNELKLLANKMDVPYQSLIKVYLRERIDKDLRKEIT